MAGLDTPEALVAFLCTASRKELQKLPSLDFQSAQNLLWQLLAQEGSLHDIYDQIRALSALLALQTTRGFPLDIQSLVDFLSRFLRDFVQNNSLLWSEEHMRDCESVLQTLLKYLQQAAAALPESTQATLWGLLERASQLPKDICTQLGLLYHAGLRASTQQRVALLAQLSGQGKIAALRGILFVVAADDVEGLLGEVMSLSETSDVSLKHYSFNVITR